jgi:hypothetical protein
MTVHIDGTYMDCSLQAFRARCEVLIAAESEKLTPDTAVVAVLCDAVRLTREMTLMQARLDALKVEVLLARTLEEAPAHAQAPEAQ